jgi:hypothetical protein
MVTCFDCWWADFDPKTGVHSLHKEIDYQAMASPTATPQYCRVVKDCAKGLKYYRTHGQWGHECPEFASYDEREQEQAELIEQKRKEFTLVTKRKKLPETMNLLSIIPVMAENSATVFDLLVDSMSRGPEFAGELIQHLNDMNIRGLQIIRAMKFARWNIETLHTLAAQRDKNLVRIVNAHPNAKEKAVESGAHLLGHK